MTSRIRHDMAVIRAEKAKNEIEKNHIEFNIDSEYILQSEKERDLSEENIVEIFKTIKKNSYISMKNDLLNLERHPIDDKKINEWVDNQPNESFRIAATKFANSIIYINFDEIISTVEYVANIIANGGEYDNAIIILGNSQNKSSHYISLILVSCIYHKYGKLPLSFSRNLMAGFQIYGFDAVYFDMDDMMYTGSQMLDSMCNLTDKLKWSFEIEEQHSLHKTINLLLKHKYMVHKNFKYRLVILYLSTYSVKEIEKSRPILFPFKIITGENFVPTLEDTIIKNIDDESIINYLIIKIFLNLNYPSITCSYFDYKIADLASTASFPLLTGYIPSSEFVNSYLNLVDGDIDEHLKALYTKITKDSFVRITEKFKNCIKINKPTKVKFINFIKNCGPNSIINNFDEIAFQKKYGVLNVFDEDNFDAEKQLDNSLINNCPKPFYKNNDASKAHSPKSRSPKSRSPKTSRKRR